MARGKTIIWSSILGFPFVLAGGLLLDETQLPTALGLPFILFGLFVVGTGAYIQWQSSPSQPHLRDGEELIDYRHPTQRVAAVKIVLSYPFLLSTMHFLFFTFLPLHLPNSHAHRRTVPLLHWHPHLLDELPHDVFHHL
ncbi:hypothetical protein [Haladaptatus halobius]|uniref:hypothetical protein n=1 Tax=Haladaptatus halobius TaxID=2884875 RepID=UPI001D0B82EA|nr:hypothetical protein [Haladaptatus halobius]